MCQFASLVLTKDAAFWSMNADSHEAIISEFKLNPDGTHGVNVCRVEITPPNGDYKAKREKWVFKVDQDITPKWWDAKEGEARARKALDGLLDARLFLDGAHTVKAGKYLAYGSSSVEAYDSSSVKAYGSSSVEAYDSSSVEAYDSSSVKAWGSSSVEAWGSSSVKAYGNSSVEAYDSSSVEAYGNSSVEAWGSSLIRICYGFAGYAVIEDGNPAIVDMSGDTPKLVKVVGKPRKEGE